MRRLLILAAAIAAAFAVAQPSAQAQKPESAKVRLALGGKTAR